MPITNKYGLPQPIVSLLDRHPYSKGKADVSITELISPPRIAQLKKRHDREIVEDVSDRFWALMGTNIHKILEDSADQKDHTTEERLFVEVDGWVVSGQIDVQHAAFDMLKIYDWKFTSVYSITHPKPEWEQQLNLYAHLVELVKGVPVDQASVIAILRDWRRSDARKRDAYPEAAVVSVDIPIWPFKKRMAFLRERVRIHQLAVVAADFDEPLPECSDEERWVRSNNVPTRCIENYCSVAPYCSQWNEAQASVMETINDKPKRSKRISK